MIFWVFEIILGLWVFATSLLFIMGQLTGGMSVAVAVGGSER